MAAHGRNLSTRSDGRSFLASRWHNARSFDDPMISAKISVVRRQVAIVRAILDELDRWLATDMNDDSLEQLLEELARLQIEVRDSLAPSASQTTPNRRPGA
jgi:hypothetical protein